MVASHLASTNMAKILGIGIATLDIINTVNGYPDEDEEVRALEQRNRRGGNASNTLTVLSQLGHHCAFSGVITNDNDGCLIKADLQKYQINTDLCQSATEGKTPTSYIAHNQLNGSRSIIHFRDLPELSFNTFKSISLEAFDWLHFEGRNIENTVKMLDYAISSASQIKRSIEIEKPRTDIEKLFPFANTLIFSKHYLHAHGQHEPAVFLADLHQRLPETDLICSWGEQGAWYHSRHNEQGHCPANFPEKIIDTLGAGDTFNAGLINALLTKKSLNHATHQACKLAGQKCGQQGLNLDIETYRA